MWKKFWIITSITSGRPRLLLILKSKRIKVTSTTDPNSPILRRFFEGYDRAFILPDEREELDGFEKCLALNTTHQYAFGRTHCEQVTVFEDDAGTLLGGANFLTVSTQDYTIPVTIALNYVYVEEAARGQGLLRKILRNVKTLALESMSIEPDATSIIFIEQNNPDKLSPEAYAIDTAHSGLDQTDRLKIWKNVGAQIIDFDYVQPALSDEQQPDTGLLFAVIDHPYPAINTSLLGNHLESFFYFSIQKGEEIQPGSVADTQIKSVLQRDIIGFR